LPYRYFISLDFLKLLYPGYSTAAMGRLLQYDSSSGICWESAHSRIHSLVIWAIAHFLSLAGSSGQRLYEREQVFVPRACVNYLRHQESAYHLMLKMNSNNKGGDYQRTFKKINQAIASAYPWLEAECQRQINLKQANF
jgi:hypothetical protein